MRSAQLAALLVALVVACKGDPTAPPVTSTLTCANPQNPDEFVGCELTLEKEAGFKVKITHISTCEARGNTFRITAPVVETLTTDGCYDEVGKERVFPGPFPAGTKITAEAQSPPLLKPPSLRVEVSVEGDYPEWILHFEDGVDDDFDDLTFTLTTLPPEE
jgi:hypothetical protein